MTFALAVTDLRWHAQMMSEPPQGLVNFWTPTPWGVSQPLGSRFGFLLKAPVRRLGGFGFFESYEEVTVGEAWNRWGPANGVQSREELHDRISEFASKRSAVPLPPEPIIGCIILRDCTFLAQEEQVAPDELGLSFPRQIVKWKRFEGELSLPFERELPPTATNFRMVEHDGGDWAQRRTKKRVGQAIFRRSVLAAYGHKCALSGADCGEALEAAHIQPFMNLASNHVQNGIALRRDLHRLFDQGLVSVDLEGRAMLSPGLASTTYAEFNGRRLNVPTSHAERPSTEALNFHREKVFRAPRH